MNSSKRTALRICKECKGEIPIGNGRQSNYGQRVYCSPNCATLADKKRQSAKRLRLQSLVDDGWAIEVKPYGATGGVLGRAERNGTVKVEKGGTAETVLDLLWKATQSSTHAGQSRANGTSS